MNTITAAAVLGALALAGCTQSKAVSQEGRAIHVAAASDVEAGRYIAVVGGCNDCHTPGWNETGGKVAEAQWLTGTPVGWQGPWGTTYPANLRLSAANLSEDEWVHMLHTRKDRPPMPWMNVNQMSEADARALYRFLKSLGPAGQPAPQGLPPGVKPKGPFIPLAPPAGL